VPYLRGIRSFAEPCAGDGTLVRHLEEFGLRCVYSGDIRDGQDVFEPNHYGAADAIITNPPYDLMYKLITHCQRILPAGLLLDMDEASSPRAARFLPHCSDIVPVGRVKWVEGAKRIDQRDYAWYRFDIRHKTGPSFHPREEGMGITAQRRV